MGAGERRLVGGKHEPGGERAARLRLGALEDGHRELGVGDLEAVAGELDFVAAAHLAVRGALAPHHVEDGVELVQEHRDALEPVRDLGGDGREIDAARLLEVRELRDLHAVHEHLPADAPGSERGRFPVVLLEAHVVVGERHAEALQAPEVHRLDVVGRGLQDDLELQVLAEAEGVLAVAAVGGPPRGLNVGAAPRLGAEDLQKVAGCMVPAPIGRS